MFSKLADHWRVSSTRQLALYGTLFLVWSVVLIGVVQWDTMNYLSGVVDQMLEQRARYLRGVERQHLPEAMRATGAVDLRNVMFYGLFDAQGEFISGNIERMPANISTDGEIRPVPGGIEGRDGLKAENARALALRLDNGEVMVLARNTNVIDRVSTIIRRALVLGFSLTVIPGLVGMWWLARGPLRRVRAIEDAVQPIMRGNLRQRLPVSTRRDELDLLAAIVNSMLDEIERLMSEVKGVCDSIAHDLRTPLTRMRTQLHRLQRESEDAAVRDELIERAVGDVDSLLERFRALLRISELEDMHRRAGFTSVDLRATLSNVREIYAPVAEEKRVAFECRVAPEVAAIDGDPHLLLEALSNLVDNAIKFTPASGSVGIALVATQRGPRIDVSDTGPGIPVHERGSVMQRFYRSTSSSATASGFGLGLSIVAAIVKLHAFRLELAENGVHGTRISIQCWRDLDTPQS